MVLNDEMIVDFDLEITTESEFWMMKGFCEEQIRDSYNAMVQIITSDDYEEMMAGSNVGSPKTEAQKLMVANLRDTMKAHIEFTELVEQFDNYLASQDDSEDDGDLSSSE